MARKAALILLTLVSPLLLVILMFGGPGLVWLGVPMICAIPVLLIVIGTGSRQPPSPFLMAIWFVLSGSWWGIGWMSSSLDLAHPSVGVAAAMLALMVVGLGLLPLVLVGWIFARTFDVEELASVEHSPKSTRKASGA
jgi:hypothetical protein